MLSISRVSNCRLRRSGVALLPALLPGLLPALLAAPLLAALAACGTNAGYGDTTVSGFDAVAVAGSFGKAPSVTWNGQPALPSAVQSKTLVQGGGAAISTSDQLEVNIYIADPLVDLYKARTGCHPSAVPAPSSSAAAAPSTSAAPAPVTVTPCPNTVSFPVKGSWVYASQSPQALTLSQANPVLGKALDGATIGSRVELLGSSTDIFPAQPGSVAGNAQLGVGTEDPVVMVVDLVKKHVEPKAHDVSPSTLPKLKVSHGKPTGFDWTGIASPRHSQTLERAVLKKGAGAVVAAGDQVRVNYLGAIYNSAKPFDESYTKQPYTTSLDSVVKGWGAGLAGIPVGSRVLLQIPPGLGYGSQAQPGIPANSTLYFVVDILAAR